MKGRLKKQKVGMFQYFFCLGLSTGCSHTFLLTNMIALQKENGDDPDMAEMITAELESLSDQLAELEERLTVGIVRNKQLVFP